MRLAGSNRFFLNPSEEETLARMARDRPRGVANRAGEGEISDGDSSASLEEISAEDFKQDAGAPPRSKVWVGYPMSRNYAPNLYSFAWAQAVQNKPLGLDLKPVGSADSPAKSAGGKPVKEEAYNVVDSSEESGGGTEKEEGELEEGEIGFGSEPVGEEIIELSIDKQENGSESEEKELDGKETEEIGEFDRRVSLILEELETVTEEEAEKSFDGVCSCLRQSFEMLKPMFAETESPVPVLDALVQQAFAGIKTVHSVLSSENLKKKEQNKDLLLRLLIHIKNQYSNILSPEQVKEIDTRVQSLVFEDDSYKESKLHAGSGTNTNDKTHLAEKSDLSSHSLVSSENSLADSSIGSKNVKAGLPKLDTPTISRGRVVSPLLDLHAEYDEENLPSPTRENAPPLPIHKPIGFGTGTVVFTEPITPKNVEAEDDTPHPYITDAFKAVSSYQQKYFFASNRLPSPTPSEEGNDKDDAHDEVSSSSANSNAGCVNTTSQIQVATSSAASTDCSSSHQPGTVKPVGQLGSAPNLAIRPALKSRDPRLRFVSSESGSASDPNIQAMSLDSSAPNNGPVGGITNPRKHKAVDESLPENHTLKRQRNGLTNSGDVQMIPGRGGGWLEDNSAVGSQPSDKIRLSENMEIEIKNPGTVVGSDRRPDSNPNIHVSNTGTCPIPSSTAAPSSSTAPSSSVAASVSFPSLLKDIAVNPTMLMQLIQMEQQRLSAEAQQKTVGLMQNMAHASSVNVLSGAVSSANVASMKSTEVGQNPAGRPQVPAQTVSTNSQSDVGRIRMKPRDPRRILHNMVQKNETVGSERAKPNGTLSSDPQSSKDHLAIGEQVEQAQATTLPTQQFAKNPKNLGDISSTLQSTTTPPAASQIISQPIQLKISKVDPRPAAAVVNDPKTVSAVTSEGSTTGPTPSTHPWGDVDHLLDGYDDQQKAAIQRERARRIAEQNNMFAARKLCLVLDLDHTLLNSAKFVEVDPVHEEILRKKEEQDREKPQRHLFRFQHMGMWTKLRPGIWNFLEKASKLYEMHLYTMGNKLYATEMAKVLDPTGTLFAGRVISRGDDGDPFDGDERVPKSKDLDGVLGMESAVVIIDDSVRVWPHNKLNLIVVERYTYFPCSRRQFGLFGPSLLEIDHDERPEDGTLASSLAVIERLHHNFFSHRSLNDIDVRNILAAEQRKILGGCKIVFSRVFPVGEANPHLHPLWQMAEQFGAVCTNQIDEQVTHVVANSLGTDKVNWALSTGRFVVHPGWVEASALLYRRVNEQDFAVK